MYFIKACFPPLFYSKQKETGKNYTPIRHFLACERAHNTLVIIDYDNVKNGEVVIKLVIFERFIGYDLI